jgi:hypothetical protein
MVEGAHGCQASFSAHHGRLSFRYLSLVVGFI